MDRMKLGQALLKTKKITKEQLKSALAMHDKIGGDFAPLLVKLGYVSDQNITSIIAKLEGINTIDISNLIIPKKLVQSIPRDVIEKHNIMPISRKDAQITIAMSQVNDYEAIEEIQFLTGCKVEPVLASRDAIRKAIIQFYYGENEMEDSYEVTSKDELDKWLKEGSPEFIALQKATIKLLIDKNILSKGELIDTAKKILS